MWMNHSLPSGKHFLAAIKEHLPLREKQIKQKSLSWNTDVCNETIKQRDHTHIHTRTHTHTQTVMNFEKPIILKCGNCTLKLETT